MKGITRDCWQELMDRKTIWVYGVITILGVLGIVGMRSLGAVHVDGQPIGGELSLAFVAAGIDRFVWLLVVLTVFITAGLVPAMLVRGRAEFYLSKPLSRGSLLLNKLAGIWFVYGAVIAAAGVLSWLAFVVLFGITAWGAMWVIVLNLAILFVWVSIIGFMGIVTGSGGMTIVGVFLAWLVQWLLTMREVVISLSESKTVEWILNTIYYILPKTSEMGTLSGQFAQGETVESWMPLWSSLLFAIVLTAVTVAVFRKKDY